MDQHTIDEIYLSTKIHFEQAKRNVPVVKTDIAQNFIQEGMLTNTILSHNSNQLDFGSYAKDMFAVLFVDMRGSTKRAKIIGPENTFLTMHAYIPALLSVVSHYNGQVIDIMGDGLMVFFGRRDRDWNLIGSETSVIRDAAYCGVAMLDIREKVINRILKENKLLPINIGIGITYGKVIVTKIGINQVYDIKAFGDCINKASKYSDGENVIRISKRIRDKWPRRKGGRIRFNSYKEGGYIVSRAGP